jgi:hypothetical protein
MCQPVDVRDPVFIYAGLVRQKSNTLALDEPQTILQQHADAWEHGGAAPRRGWAGDRDEQQER